MIKLIPNPITGELDYVDTSQWIETGSNIYNKNSASVGIGTASPTSLIHIASDLNMPTTPNATSQVHFKTTTADGTTAGILIDNNQIESVGGPLYINNRALSNNILLAQGQGCVGIESNAPTAKLHITQGGTGSFFLKLGDTLNSVNRVVVTGSGFLSLGKGNSPEFVLEIEGDTNVNAGFRSTIYSADNGGIYFGARKARGTLAAPTQTLAGDRLAGLYGVPFAGSWVGNNVAIQLVAEQNTGSNSAPTYIDFATTSSGATARTERMRITGSGYVGIGTATPDVILDVNGFTQLGSDAPKIKMKKLTGTTAASEGTSTTIAHGLTVSKILAVDVLVTNANGQLVPHAFVNSAGFQYDYFVTATDVNVGNHATNSENLLNRAITVLITYEE